MPAKNIHPGEQLAHELEEHGMSAAELARRLKVPAAAIADILNGRNAITVEIAVQFAHAFDTSARFWLSLQSLYDLSQNNHKSARA
jgi:addiction module HigA family antidote